jgi:pyruvate dehydrogenase E2 component (dihydrolipoamide acetyltransferase)
VRELKLPELGENIETAEVTNVLVKEGDVIERDQPIIEAETDKASFEVPAEAAGKVAEVMVKSGDTIRVGQTIFKIDSGEDDAAEKNGKAKEEEKEDGEGKKTTQGQEVESTGTARVEPEEEGEKKAAKPEIGPTAPAAPSVRALARELGVEIMQVEGSGPGGRISADDVKRHARTIIERSAEEPTASTAGAPAVELPDFTRWGEVERVSLSGVRRATARSMATAWAQVPHVTQADRADVTDVEALRRRFNQRADAERTHLTWTAMVVKVSALALRRFPRFNASLDLADSSLILKKYVHVGVAVDTDRGLLVPVIRDADRKGLGETARELEDLAQRAREKKISLEEMEGACFTVTNLGGLGTTLFSPIVHWPEVAILGVGRAERVLRQDDEKIGSRLILPLSLSYDHRAVDGADAARFLRWIAEALEQPFLMMANS